MLAEHPAMAARLRREVLAVVGGSRMPTYDDVRGMKYLRAFINGAYTFSIFSCHCNFANAILPAETLRLYPPVCAPSILTKTAFVFTYVRLDPGHSTPGRVYSIRKCGV